MRSLTGALSPDDLSLSAARRALDDLGSLVNRPVFLLDQFESVELSLWRCSRYAVGGGVTEQADGVSKLPEVKDADAATDDAQGQPVKVSTKERCRDVDDQHSGPNCPQKVEFAHGSLSGCRSHCRQIRLMNATACGLEARSATRWKRGQACTACVSRCYVSSSSQRSSASMRLGNVSTIRSSKSIECATTRSFLMQRMATVKPLLADAVAFADQRVPTDSERLTDKRPSRLGDASR